MDRKYYVWGGVLLALVLVVGIIYPRPTSVVERIVEKLGATPGGTIPGEELCVNGVCTITKSGFCAATSTPISVRNPHNATSTVSTFIDFTGTSTSAISYALGTSTLPSLPVSLTMFSATVDGMNLLSSSSIPIATRSYFRSGSA